MPNPGAKRTGPNRVTVEARDALWKTFCRLGGADGMERWAKENPDEFYTKLFPKLVPAATEVSGEDGGPVTITIGWRSST